MDRGIYSNWKQWFVKIVLMSFSLHKMLIDGLWIIVMFLISCLDSHSDGTHSLQRIHW